jgi:hypothetical protein
LDDWKRKKKAFDEAARKRKERRKRKRLRKERMKDSVPLERRQEKEAPGIQASQNQIVKRKSPVVEPEKAQPNSVEIGREKQDDEQSKLGTSNASRNSLMVELSLKTAKSIPNPSATSTSSADVNAKSNQPTTTPKAVTVPSNAPTTREPGKKIVEQSKSKSEVPKASDSSEKTTKSGPDKRPTVSAINGSSMTDEPENSNIRRSSTVTAQPIPTSVTKGKTKDPITTTQSKLFSSELFTFLYFTLTLMNRVENERWRSYEELGQTS